MLARYGVSERPAAQAHRAAVGWRVERVEPVEPVEPVERVERVEPVREGTAHCNLQLPHGSA